MNRPYLWVALAGASFLFAACGRDEPPDPCGGFSDFVTPTASASVALSPGLTIVTSPATLTIAPGARASFVAVATGFPMPQCRDYELTIGWSVSDTTVAQVERDTGSTTVVLGRALGRTSVIATVLARPVVRAASLLEVVAP